MSRDAFDPFEALDLPRDASAHEIKSKYHALARRYHPNRHPGSDESKTALAERFHQIHQAWQLLSKADNRRRRLELLKLLELQDEMLQHFFDLLDAAESPTEQRKENNAPISTPGTDGYLSSDADEDLPHVGIKRRQTDLKRGARHLGDSLASNDPAQRNGRLRFSDLPSVSTAFIEERPKQSDYFSLRRKKLSKLRQKEVDAFVSYRNAMVAKFEAEEEAERQHEAFERARWRREYFERAPKETSELMRSFQHFVGAVRAFHTHSTRSRNRADTGYGPVTPIVGPDSQFLFPDNTINRRKSTHRRHWSSDISGDQTSSDDDSLDHYPPRRVSPTGYPGYPGQPAVKSPPMAWSEWHDPPGRPADPKPDPNVSFQFVLKRPTDLNSNAGGSHNSSGDTNSDPSRSPSPQVAPDMFKFTLLPPSGTAELFDFPEDRRARSPSPSSHRRAPSFPTTDRDMHIPPTEVCHFTTKQVGPPQFRNISADCVYCLPYDVKSRLLAVKLNSDIDPAQLLDRLARLDPASASKFMVKPDIKESFNFRLIYNDDKVKPEQQESFIALSYRRKLHVEKYGGHYSLPLDPEVFQAVWDERQSDTEGVWIDQICIDQESDLEKTISMSAMDMVYRGARLIVVALDDIELSAHEGDLLQNHMDEYAKMSHVAPRQRFRRKQPPYLETHDDLFQVIRKILRSSWFRRAWCRHEMRLAKKHVFLLPCRRPGSWSGRDVLRFNGKCIDHLLALSTEVPFEKEVENVKPALHAFFRDRSKMSADSQDLRHHHGNFTTVVAEVFGMEAGGDPRIPEEQRRSDARKDMISIVLNTMECGLALNGHMRRPDVHFSDHDCYRHLLFLALAAQDPGALCSVGAPLPMVLQSPYGPSSSWMYVPTVADSGLNNFKTLYRFPKEAEFHTATVDTCDYIQLDLHFFERNRAMANSPEMLQLAEKIMNVCDEKKWGRNRKRYLTHDRRAVYLFGEVREIYIETLSCVLQCGPNWMSDVCERYRMSRWKIDLRAAWDLMVALLNTDGKWPVTAWSERAAGWLVDFTHFLIVRGLPQRQLTKPEKWRPIWVRTGSGKVLTFMPFGNKNLYPAVPTALSHPDYVHLARLWALEPRSPQADADCPPSEWTLLGKSVLFSDEASIEQMKLRQRAVVREQQKIYGRDDQAPKLQMPV